MLKALRKIQRSIIRRAERIKIPGYKNVSLRLVSHFYFQTLAKGRIGARSAGISFKFIMALFPLIIFIFSTIPFLPIDNLQTNLMVGLKSFFPEQVFYFFEEVITDLVHKKHSVLLSIGFILTLYFSSNAVDALISGLNSSYLIKRKRQLWKQKIWSLALLIIFFLLFVITFLLTSFGTMMINYLYENDFIESNSSYWLLIVVKSLLSLFIFMFSISLLYNVANTEKTQWRILNPGAMTSTILIIILKESFGLYLTYFGKFDQIYGPIGAGLAFMLFMYYLFILLIIGFELNMSLERAYYKKNYNFEAGSLEMEELRKAKLDKRKNKS